MFHARKRILIVDDHEAIVDALEILLEGHEVVTATSIPEARSALRRVRPDLILLDCLLPGISGVQFLREIRQMGISAKVVAITGSAYDWVQDEVNSLGIDGFLHKPFDVDAIMSYAQACG